jgi:hypothetical protein
VFELVLVSNPPPAVRLPPEFELVVTLFLTKPTFKLFPQPELVFATVVTVAFEFAAPVFELVLVSNPPPRVALRPEFALVLTLLRTAAKLKFAANEGTAEATKSAAVAPSVINFLYILFFTSFLKEIKKPLFDLTNSGRKVNRKNLNSKNYVVCSFVAKYLRISLLRICYFSIIDPADRKVNDL